MPDSQPSPLMASPADPAKALLLCEHARELSRNCLTAVRHGATDRMLELQGRKHAVVQALAAILHHLDLPKFPDLCRAVDALRESLRTETGALANASNNLQNDFLTLGAAEQRLVQARRYDSATARPVRRKSGSQFSASG